MSHVDFQLLTVRTRHQNNVYSWGWMQAWCMNSYISARLLTSGGCPSCAVTAQLHLLWRRFHTSNVSQEQAGHIAPCSTFHRPPPLHSLHKEMAVTVYWSTRVPRIRALKYPQGAVLQVRSGFFPVLQQEIKYTVCAKAWNCYVLNLLTAQVRLE